MSSRAKASLKLLQLRYCGRKSEVWLKREEA